MEANDCEWTKALALFVCSMQRSLVGFAENRAKPESKVEIWAESCALHTLFSALKPLLQ